MILRRFGVWPTVLVCGLVSGLAWGCFAIDRPLLARSANLWRLLPAWSPVGAGVLRPVRADRLGSDLAADLGLDEQLWPGSQGEPGDRQNLLTAIDRSLGYLATPQAERAYPIAGINREHVRQSLLHFRDLLQTATSSQALWAAVRRDFDLYQATGRQENGRVLFTAYYEPVFAASRQRTAVYRYPLYRRPPDLDRWSRPHPSREALEGRDGLQGSRGRLRGLELVWLRDRFEAYLIHVQGSARLVLADGQTMTVGYAGHTAQDYTSVGRSLADDGKLNRETLRMPDITRYFQEHPAAMDVYLPRDRSFVFFEESHGRGATGSIGVELVPDRSIATDKRLMPPGALALIASEFPFPNLAATPAATPGTTPGSSKPQGLTFRRVSRFVLDQDTGGAIQGPGRVDYFVGSGPIAGDRAGLTKSEGSLYYVLLKRSAPERS